MKTLAELNRWPFIEGGFCKTCGHFVYLVQIRFGEAEKTWNEMWTKPFDFSQEPK